MTKKTKEELRAEIPRVFPDSYATDMFSTPEQVLWYEVDPKIRTGG